CYFLAASFTRAASGTSATAGKCSTGPTATLGKVKPYDALQLINRCVTPVVLAVVEPESTVGLQDRQERTVDPCLSLAGIEDIHCVLLVVSQKGRTLANTSGQKAVRRAVFGGCDAGILRGATLSDGSAAGASITGTTSAGTRSRAASTGRGTAY